MNLCFSSELSCGLCRPASLDILQRWTCFQMSYSETIAIMDHIPWRNTQHVSTKKADSLWSWIAIQLYVWSERRPLSHVLNSQGWKRIFLPRGVKMSPLKKLCVLLKSAGLCSRLRAPRPLCRLRLSLGTDGKLLFELAAQRLST